MKSLLRAILKWLRIFAKEKFQYESEDLPFYVTIVVSLILFIVGLNIFVEFTEELAENSLETFDEQVTAYIVDFRNDTLTPVFRFATDLGDTVAYLVVMILFAIYFLMKHRSWKFILQTLLTLILASGSNWVLKKVINRERPSLEHLVSVNTLSYPSGHSMSAMAFYGFLIYLLLRYRINLWIKVPLIVLLTLVILAVGISRIYLGVHYPSDVVGGFVGGIIWVTLCAILFNLADLLRQRRNRLNLRKHH